MSTPFARHCHVEDTALSGAAQVPVCPCRVDPTSTAPVIVGFELTAIVPGDTVTGADATVVGVIPAADLVTVATSGRFAAAGRTWNDVLSLGPAPGAPPPAQRRVVVVGVGLQERGSRLPAPPTVAAPLTSGGPRVGKGCGAAGGVKSTLTTPPAAPI